MKREVQIFVGRTPLELQTNINIFMESLTDHVYIKDIEIREGKGKWYGYIVIFYNE